MTVVHYYETPCGVDRLGNVFSALCSPTQICTAGILEKQTVEQVTCPRCLSLLAEREIKRLARTKS